MRNKDTIIRRAKTGDETGIARVHVRAWQEAYRGLLPQSFLDQLPETFERRENMWRRMIGEPDNIVIQVAECNGEIIGFASFAAGRATGMESQAEVQAIYLLEEHKGKGIGFSLLSSGFKCMQERQFKAGYCWVLENNPTIRFYERTGARFNGMIKEDQIGGEKVRELAYCWSSLNVGDYNWQPLSVDQVNKLFAPIKCRWWIAGGWAIDLFINRQTRAHDDIDIIIAREDQDKIQQVLNQWELWAADPPGTLRPWRTGEYLGKGIQDIWARPNTSEPWRIQIMLFDTQNEQWIFKRDESIRKDLSKITLKSSEGIHFLAPEIQLLYKSKSLREKDEIDFGNALPMMSLDQKTWLKQTLQKVYANNHRWISRL